MKRLSLAAVLLLTSGFASAEHPLMKRFDLDSNGSVTTAELEQAGCNIRSSMFKTADKNKDGTLSKKELLKAKNYIATKKRCPKTAA